MRLTFTGFEFIVSILIFVSVFFYEMRDAPFWMVGVFYLLGHVQGQIISGKR